MRFANRAYPSQTELIKPNAFSTLSFPCLVGSANVTHIETAQWCNDFDHWCVWSYLIVLLGAPVCFTHETWLYADTIKINKFRSWLLFLVLYYFLDKILNFFSVRKSTVLYNYYYLSLDFPTTTLIYEIWYERQGKIKWLSKMTDINIKRKYMLSICTNNNINISFSVKIKNRIKYIIVI